MASASNTVIAKKKIKVKDLITKKHQTQPQPEPQPNVSIADNNYVCEQYKSAPGVVEFLLQNAYYAMNCERADTIFEPIPPSWKTNTTAQEQLLDIPLEIKSYLIHNNIIKNVDNIVSAIQESYNDAELIDKLNEKTYELVKFILESNKMMIKIDNLLKSTDIITTRNDLVPKDMEYKPEDFQKYLQSILQFKLIHTQIIEDNFKDKKTVYLYHGSRYENWFSIMRNGVKIGSKNKYFLNGAAYGQGIYLSNDINLSLGYSRTSQFATIQKGKYSDNQMILAIFEVIDNPKWHKAGTIFVVDDENALVLRYLLVFNSDCASWNGLQAIFNAINVKLNSGGIKALEKEKRDMETKNITTIHSKRLMREYQMIMKQSHDVLGFRIQLAEEDNLGKWMVYITNPQNEKLEKQMRKLGIPAIEIEITFKDTYPIAPPFIRVVYPRFIMRTGHITIGGSLCMEMLTNQGWCPTFNVENVITQIKLAISDGGGEIDETNWGKRYSMDEAQDAFKRVLATHGWV
jgi:ubiquitin-protein ligase